MTGPGPLLALRAAILAHVQSDAELAALMGGRVRLADEPPRAAEPVYAVFGPSTVRDVSTFPGRSDDVRLDIVVWARPGSAASGLAAAERLAGLIDDAPLSLSGHRLVLLRVADTAASRDGASGLVRITLGLHAHVEHGPAEPDPGAAPVPKRPSEPGDVP